MWIALQINRISIERLKLHKALYSFRSNYKQYNTIYCILTAMKVIGKLDMITIESNHCLLFVFNGNHVLSLHLIPKWLFRLENIPPHDLKICYGISSGCEEIANNNQQAKVISFIHVNIKQWAIDRPKKFTNQSKHFFAIKFLLIILHSSMMSHKWKRNDINKRFGILYWKNDNIMFWLIGYFGMETLLAKILNVNVMKRIASEVIFECR